MTKASLEFAQFISSVDQIRESAKAAFLLRIDNPNDDCQSIHQMLNEFDVIANMDVDPTDDRAKRLRAMGRFAMLGIGLILQSICEDELTEQKEDATDGE
jgi:hypothetical protein